MNRKKFKENWSQVSTSIESIYFVALDTFTLTFLRFCWDFQNTCFPKHLEAEASVYFKKQNFENYILGKLQISCLRLFLAHLNLKADSDQSVYGCKHFLKKLQEIKQANTLSTLTWFSRPWLFYLRFRFFWQQQIQISYAFFYCQLIVPSTMQLRSHV